MVRDSVQVEKQRRASGQDRRGRLTGLFSKETARRPVAISLPLPNGKEKRVQDLEPALAEGEAWRLLAASLAFPRFARDRWDDTVWRDARKGKANAGRRLHSQKSGRDARALPDRKGSRDGPEGLSLLAFEGEMELWFWLRDRPEACRCLACGWPETSR